VNSAWGTGSCKTNYLLLFVAPATGKQIALPRTQISGLSVPPGKKSVDLERWVGGLLPVGRGRLGASRGARLKAVSTGWKTCSAGRRRLVGDASPR
jgi:hypothetical protein